MERVEPDDAGFTEFLCAVESPGSPQAFPKQLLVFFQPRRSKEVFAVKRVFEAEEIQDGFDQAAALRGREIPKNRDVLPESGVARRFVDVLVFHPKQRTLLEVRQD